MRADLKFGDLICYRAAAPALPHDVPLMYVGRCSHSSPFTRRDELIDIFDIGGRYVFELEHKSSAMWQRCKHLQPYGR